MVGYETHLAFTLLVVVVAIQRLLELRLSRCHERMLLARGGREHAPEQMPWMRALHASWLLAMVAEVWLLERPFPPELAAAAFAIFAVGQMLRIVAMRTLGERWTVKIFTLPGAAPVSTGIFRWLRHPNYLGVVLEMVALPLVHGAFLTAGAFSALNGLLLFFRIRAEEASLANEGGYGTLARTPRLIPRAFASRNER